jgi:amphi-Trp domain-containing protein
MVEKTLFKFEDKISKNEIAKHLDRISEKLKSGEPITFQSNENIELQPSDRPEFEVKVEEEGNELSLEVEIEWDKGETNSSLEIS